MTSIIEIFCCYARKDQPLLQSLKTHLMPLQWQGLITIWSDTDINVGAAWEKEIHQRLDTAQMILLLISPDFMASEYCYSKEMQRHEQQEAHVIPILLRPTYWKGTPFARLQMLPTNAKAVTAHHCHSEDEALYYEEALTAYTQAIQLSTPHVDPQFYHDKGVAHERLAEQAYEQEKQARTEWQPKESYFPWLLLVKARRKIS